MALNISIVGYIGSLAVSGAEPWPPLPVILMSTKAIVAITAPGLT